MKLVPDWQRVITFSISFWMQMLGLAALIVPEVRYLATGIDTNPIMLWWIGVLFLLTGMIGRVFQQGNSKWVEYIRLTALVVLVTLSAVLAASYAHAGEPSEEETLSVAVPFIAGWEGKSNQAYLDRIASPPVWTICHGETRGIKAGDTRTDEECAAMLREGLSEFRLKLHAYFTETTRANRLTPWRDTAYVSLAWNAGIGGIGRSTATRRLNAGDIAGGCQALTWWNKAGGRVIRGLVNRRNAERDLCMRGL